MLRKEEFINAPVQYDYKIDAIEQFLDRVEQKRYEWAINYLPPAVEDAKLLDLSNYHPDTFESDERNVKKYAESLNDMIDNAQRENFEQKYREGFDSNVRAIMAIEDYSCFGFIGGDKQWLKVLAEKDERVKNNALNLLSIHKNSDKDNKEIRASFKQQLDELKSARGNLKERKAHIKAQKEQFSAFGKKFGKQIFKFDLEMLAEGQVEELARKYAKLEREYLRNEIYSRTSQYVGKLVDMIEIEWGMNGSLNGVVIGEKGDKAHVETIIAGGYNIQCEHYRVLVKPIN